MSRTSIEWTDHSISPIRARSKETGKVFHFCERISPGCAHCYAATMAHRFGLPDYIKANRDKVEFFLDESKLKEVLRRRKPTRFFWEDCSDLFGDWVKDEWLDKCFAVMALTPQHTHQVLTKRPERMLEYMTAPDVQADVWHARDELARKHGIWHPSWSGGETEKQEHPDNPAHTNVIHHAIDPAPVWPPRNACLGVSVEDQKRATERIQLLLKTPAAVRFLSCEPLLGPVNLSFIKVPYGEDHDRDQGWLRWDALTGFRANKGGGYTWPEKIDWVIVGGESGPGARPCNIDWIRSIVAQCKAAGTACFVKQLGSVPFEDDSAITGAPIDKAKLTRLPGAAMKDKKGGDMQEWPADLRVREMPEVNHA